jgi:hypothetical protein
VNEIIKRKINPGNVIDSFGRGIPSKTTIYA